MSLRHWYDEKISMVVDESMNSDTCFYVQEVDILLITFQYPKL